MGFILKKGLIKFPIKECIVPIRTLSSLIFSLNCSAALLVYVIHNIFLLGFLRSFLILLDTEVVFPLPAGALTIVNCSVIFNPSANLTPPLYKQELHC